MHYVISDLFEVKCFDLLQGRAWAVPGGPRAIGRRHGESN